MLLNAYAAAVGQPALVDVHRVGGHRCAGAVVREWAVDLRRRFRETVVKPHLLTHRRTQFLATFEVAARTLVYKDRRGIT
jgi:hypothetical protein